MEDARNLWGVTARRIAGGIHAALDRQHPRDLFDIAKLHENEGLADGLLRTFMVYLASSSRPAHEFLDPSAINFERAFDKEFVGVILGTGRSFRSTRRSPNAD